MFMNNRMNMQAARVEGRGHLAIFMFCCLQ